MGRVFASTLWSDIASPAFWPIACLDFQFWIDCGFDRGYDCN